MKEREVEHGTIESVRRSTLGKPFLRDGDPLGGLFRPRLGEGHGENTLLHVGLDILRLDSSGQGNRPRELAVPALAHRVPVLILLRGRRGLTGDHEAVVVDVDADVLLFEPGEVERRGDAVVLGGLVDIHVWPEGAGRFVTSAPVSVAATTMVMASSAATTPEKYHLFIHRPFLLSWIRMCQQMQGNLRILGKEPW